ISLGAALEKTGELAAAEAAFRKAAQLDPKSSEAIAGLANIYMRSRRFLEAEAMLRKLMTVDPANNAARVQLGRVLAAQGRHADAAEALEVALKSSADPPAL